MCQLSGNHAFDQNESSLYYFMPDPIPNFDLHKVFSVKSETTSPFILISHSWLPCGRDRHNSWMGITQIRLEALAFG